MLGVRPNPPSGWECPAVCRDLGLWRGVPEVDGEWGEKLVETGSERFTLGGGVGSSTTGAKEDPRESRRRGTGPQGQGQG